MGFFKHENLGGYPENNLWDFSSIRFQRNIGGNFCGTFKHDNLEGYQENFVGLSSMKKIQGGFRGKNLWDFSKLTFQGDFEGKILKDFSSMRI